MLNGRRKVRAPKGTWCRITSGEGNLRESAAENKPPTAPVVGKAETVAVRAHRLYGNINGQGKPHQEQDQASGYLIENKAVLFFVPQYGRSQEVFGNKSPRLMAITPWYSRWYRTRLTECLMCDPYCLCGGIGRRDRLKICCPSGCGSSSLPKGTRVLIKKMEYKVRIKKKRTHI